MGAFPLREIRLPDPEAWSLLRKARSRVRIGELELRWISPAPDGEFRMGITLRRKNGVAPLRNRIRRQLRETVRLLPVPLQGVWIQWSFPPRRLTSPTQLLKTQALQSLVDAKLVRA